ncbi:VRR-NUC domain-containing protein [uncultured Microbulbifer sp.]|uniref:VRR-NUC domain-containing protein n=1 Tax=uncultured Microbulbifer sp. TaxID=348147 RepID=UPI002629897E|nr:VRR-NUC domain-containing protein [uncultured Microbulbifer sp.]
MTDPIELAPDYYLSNFHALLGFVVARYADLLSDGERLFYDRFHGLDADSQRLYVRLLSRKGVPSSCGALFRQHKLDYGEIAKLPFAVERLVTVGLLQRNPDLPLPEILPLFTKSELFANSPEPQPRSLNRPALEQALLEQDRTQIRRSLERDEPLLAVQSAEHFETFKLLFFGNLNQDLTDFVLRDLGLFRYEQYPLEQDQLPFYSRAQIEQYLRYYECLREAESALVASADDIVALASALPAGIDSDNTLHRRLDRLRLTLARQLERLGALVEADQLYARCTRPPARERRARIAVANGDTTAALALCSEILTAPHHEAERSFAEGFGYRTAKKAGTTEGWAAPDRHKPPTQTVALTQAAERVETIAAHYLAQQAPGNQCFYVENSLFNGVLGLFVWDILFAPIPGAFFNPFQTAPSDFRTPDFFSQRRGAFERRLAAMDTDVFHTRVWQCYRDKQGIANPLVHWDALPEPLLSLALERVSTNHWRALFRRLLSDIAHHRSGLPDLILFPAGGGFELVEVKGPGDRLQQNQQRWLAYFAEHTIPHRVLHVEWQP